MKKFTLVEFLTILAIIMLLVGLLIPVLVKAKHDAKIKKFQNKYKDVIPTETLKNIASLKIVKDDDKKNNQIYNQLELVADGKLDLDKADLLVPYLTNKQTKTEPVVIEQPKGQLYDRWASFTGNPRKLTRQEFDALAEKDMIPELQFYNWSTATGNPKGFSKEQFEVLKSKSLITFDKK